MYNISVILEKILIQEYAYGVSYSVSVVVVPQVAMITNRTHVELTVHYNTLYNISVIGSFCGHNSESATIGLFYGEFLVSEARFFESNYS